MAIFLNREKFNFWIPKLITQADEEVLLIVPYIKTSETVFNALKKANKANKRIVIVYRENKLDNTEKEKLLALDNLDLLHHPNIHCKCYYNGDLLIIGSMNLYEYSEKNNREMGAIFSNLEEGAIEEKYNVDFFQTDEYHSILEPLEEIRQIINGSTLEKKSKITIEKEFKLNTIQTEFEKTLKDCASLNKHFGNKTFRPVIDEKAKSENLEFYDIMCSNYFDNIDLVIEERRLKLTIKSDEKEKIFDLWKKNYDEFKFKGFKHYWNWHTQPIYIYQDSKYEFWDKNEENNKKILDAYQKGLIKVFAYYQKLKKEIK
jgi:phosphatidylserine/phosphatidylglycerophosphate/cardiolipin synthase-like enzyme